MIGILDLIGGASRSSRFYIVDNVVIRLIGGALIVFGLALFTRRDWAFIGMISVLALSIVEVVLTIEPSTYEAPKIVAICQRIVYQLSANASLTQVMCRSANASVTLVA